MLSLSGLDTGMCCLLPVKVLLGSPPNLALPALTNYRWGVRFLIGPRGVVTVLVERRAEMAARTVTGET